MTGKTWKRSTPEQLKQREKVVCKMRKEGQSIARISDYIGVSPEIVRRICLKNDISSHRKNEELESVFFVLRRSGWAYTAIANHLEVSYTKVRRACLENNVFPDPRRTAKWMKMK
jgi:transposase